MPQTPPQTDTYNTALDIFDRTHPLRVDADENLKVTGTFTPSGTQDVSIIGSVPIPVTQSGSWTVSLTSESIEIGTVDQGTPTTEINAWPVYLQRASSASVTSVTVTGSSTLLLAANPSRKAFTVQCKDTAVYITLGPTSSTSLYSSYVLKLNEYERNDYTGPVSAILTSGSVDVMVTELV